ncbi:FlgN family protein [Caballeronia catudaia]|uniref:FlgN family protein n=1 Tax=Caballeronia catudaia TaxID=1777136 RepID=A0A157Z142_9BURK|nr:flagellar protein FlgN [Caballeronia catudaia]SAK39163.1 FlgN family protein [Caballeronia catudaia]
MKDALLATVTEEVAAVQAFENLLVEEEKALIAAQPLPALPSIIEHKTALTERISVLEKTRDEQLNALGFPGGFAGMEAAAASDEAIAGQWALLTASARRAKQGNNNNGVLIRTRMEYNRKALAALQVAPSKSGFYGPDGRVPGA